MEKKAGIWGKRVISSGSVRGLLVMIMAAAFIFGFMKSSIGVDFERLHIFLFNLTCGGFLILYYTEGKDVPGIRSLAFLTLSVVYAVLVFFRIYIAAFPVSLAMAALVESYRLCRFSFFPMDFFRRSAVTARKFHQASLLCLSLALLISTLVILNNEFYHWVTIRKLTLNVFFLGFSFPVSLITLSITFSIIDHEERPWLQWAGHFIFWTVNLGVIIFFAFILLEWMVPEVIMASLLGVTVLIAYTLFFLYGIRSRQKLFLVSGMVFLLLAAVTGVTYIAVLMGYLGKNTGELILSSHSYLSLYGWNLCGMMLIMRRVDFPRGINSAGVLAVLWITVGLLAPLGRLYPVFAVAAAVSFVFFLIFFLRAG